MKQQTNNTIKTKNQLISEIEIAHKGLPDSKKDDATLKIIYPYAHEVNEILSKEQNFMIASKKMYAHPFVAWLNISKRNFDRAKVSVWRTLTEYARRMKELFLQFWQFEN